MASRKKGRLGLVIVWHKCIRTDWGGRGQKIPRLWDIIYEWSLTSLSKTGLTTFSRRSYCFLTQLSCLHSGLGPSATNTSSIPADSKALMKMAHCFSYTLPWPPQIMSRLAYIIPRQANKSTITLGRLKPWIQKKYCFSVSCPALWSFNLIVQLWINSKV